MAISKAQLTFAVIANILCIYCCSYGRFHIKDYNPEGDGITNDVNAIKDAINRCFNDGKKFDPKGNTEIIGGKVIFDSKVYLCDSDLYVKPNVSLLGTYRNDDEAETIDYRKLNVTKIFLNKNSRITFGNGASVKGIMFIRKGLTEDANEAGFAGTAVIPTASVYIDNCAFLGFETAIDTDPNKNTPRITITHVNIDCTNGIKISCSLDISRVHNVQVRPFLSKYNKDNTRNGVAFYSSNINDWGKFINCKAHGYKTGFLLDRTNSNVLHNCQVSYPVTGGDREGTGIEARGVTNETLISNFKAINLAEGIRIDTKNNYSTMITSPRFENCKRAIHLTGGGRVGIHGGYIKGQQNEDATGIIVDCNKVDAMIDCVSFDTLECGLYNKQSNSFGYDGCKFVNVAKHYKEKTVSDCKNEK
ncbi:MAG: hypothetical protein ACYSSI_04635 [Planctomycetota bacterium]|jgi:hypothetical protein